MAEVERLQREDIVRAAGEDIADAVRDGRPIPLDLAATTIAALAVNDVNDVLRGALAHAAQRIRDELARR